MLKEGMLITIGSKHAYQMIYRGAVGKQAVIISAPQSAKTYGASGNMYLVRITNPSRLSGLDKNYHKWQIHEEDCLSFFSESNRDATVLLDTDY